MTIMGGRFRRPLRSFALACATLLAASAIFAADPGPLAPFQPPPNTTRTLRLWGSAPLANLVKLWAEGFQKLHPDLRIETRLDGTGVAMPGLYTGAADLALFGREPNRTDSDGFEHVLNYKHLRVELATGSLDQPGHTAALAVFVHRDNPLARLTLAQLDAIFGAELRRGGKKILRTWGDLGLAGEWAARPLNLYAPDTRSGPGAFFQQTVLLDSGKWNWERLTEFPADENTAARILAALAADRDGLAIASLGVDEPRVKPLALAGAEKFFAPTREHVASRDYPLARAVLAVVNRPPGAPLEEKVAAFLRYALGAEGQAAVARSGVYLPLSAESLRRQFALLE